MADENTTTKAEQTTQADENKTTNKKAGKKADERVEVFIPRGTGRDEPNLFVGVNGKSYLLPKGKTSLVPPEVAAEIKRSNMAQEAQDNRKDELIEKAQEIK